MLQTSEIIEAGKYLVALHDGAWRLSCGEAEVGVFASRPAATEQACRLACLKARAGSVGVVVVQDDVRELHCFSPGDPEPCAANDQSLAIAGGSV